MTVFIVNPNAAGGSTRRRWQQLEALACALFPGARTLWTEARGHARKLAFRAAQEGCSLIVAVGGDGTVSEVVDGILQARRDAGDRRTRVELGIIPSGTGGDLIRSLNIPADPGTALEALARTESRLIDVGAIDYQNHAGVTAVSHFINVADAGLGGETVASIDAYKRLPGTLAYLAGTVAAMLRHSARPLQIWIDEEAEPRLMSAGVVAVANGCFFGSGMCISPKSALDDGYLDLVAIPYRAPLRSVGLFRKIYQGRVLEDPEVFSARVRSVRMEPLDAAQSPILLDVDGEQPGTLPARFKVLPKVLRIRA